MAKVLFVVLSIACLVVYHADASPFDMPTPPSVGSITPPNPSMIPKGVPSVPGAEMVPNFQGMPLPNSHGRLRLNPEEVAKFQMSQEQNAEEIMEEIEAQP